MESHFSCSDCIPNFEKKSFRFGTPNLNDRAPKNIEKKQKKT